MNKDKSDTGAIWCNKGKGNKPDYLNGCIEYEGKVIRFVAYKNKFKAKKKQPDYILYVKEVEEENIEEESKEESKEELNRDTWWSTHEFIF